MTKLLKQKTFIALNEARLNKTTPCGAGWAGALYVTDTSYPTETQPTPSRHNLPHLDSCVIVIACCWIRAGPEWKTDLSDIPINHNILVTSQRYSTSQTALRSSHLYARVLCWTQTMLFKIWCAVWFSGWFGITAEKAFGKSLLPARWMKPLKPYKMVSP